MSNVYSTQFIVSHAGATKEYLCPGGFRAVVRCVTAFNSSAVSNDTYNLIHVDSDATICWGSISQGLGAPGEFSSVVLMHFVFNEGETIKSFADGTIDMSVSGFLLTLP